MISLSNTDIINKATQAFLECSNLRTVNILSEVLTQVGAFSFKDIAMRAVIYVPNTTIKQLFDDSVTDATVQIKN